MSTVAERLGPVLAAVFPGGPPVRLRGWDGSEAGPAGGPVVVLRSRRALRRLLWQPGELGLAEAYAAGELDVEGDLSDALSRVGRALRDARPPWSTVAARGAAAALRLGALGPRPPAPAAPRAHLHGRPHTPTRDRAAIAHHYDLSNAWYAALLDPSMAYSCGYWLPEPESWPDGRAARSAGAQGAAVAGSAEAPGAQPAEATPNGRASDAPELPESYTADLNAGRERDASAGAGGGPSAGAEGVGVVPDGQASGASESAAGPAELDADGVNGARGRGASAGVDGGPSAGAEGALAREVGVAPEGRASGASESAAGPAESDAADLNAGRGRDASVGADDQLGGGGGGSDRGLGEGDVSRSGLARAQRVKVEVMCRKLGLGAGARLLDVGCGWGSLALYAARERGVRVTAVTLSREQRDAVAARVREEGLGGLVEVRLCHYRELAAEEEGGYDAVAAVEMGEHVGAREYPGFAALLRRMLRPEGRLLIQQMSRSSTAPGGGAFIETYVAPDMHMRPVGETIALLEAAGLEVRSMESLREHYVLTIDAWTRTLEEDWPRFTALAGEATARLWRLYLVGASLAFAEGRMGVDQILAVRRTPDGRSGMPPTPRDWYAAGSRTRPGGERP